MVHLVTFIFFLGFALVALGASWIAIKGKRLLDNAQEQKRAARMRQQAMLAAVRQPVRHAVRATQR